MIQNKPLNLSKSLIQNKGPNNKRRNKTRGSPEYFIVI